MTLIDLIYNNSFLIKITLSPLLYSFHSPVISLTANPHFPVHQILTFRVAQREFGALGRI